MQGGDGFNARPIPLPTSPLKGEGLASRAWILLRSRRNFFGEFVGKMMKLRRRYCIESPSFRRRPEPNFGNAADMLFARTNWILAFAGMTRAA
jgi:hypothetical protein